MALGAHAVSMALAAWAARWARLSLPARLAWIVGGYLFALALAALALFILVTLTDGPDRVASSGMHAFSDALAFLCVFALGAIVPTGLLLIGLRSVGWPWRVFSWMALGIAITGLLASLEIRRMDQASAWSALAVLRIFATPFAAGLFALVGLIAPHRASRWRLFVAVALQSAAGAYGFVH